MTKYKVTCIDSPKEAPLYAIYYPVGDKMVLDYVNFTPNYFEPCFTHDEFDVEFAYNKVEII